MKNTEKLKLPTSSGLKGDLAPGEEQPRLVEPPNLGGIALIGSLAPDTIGVETPELEAEDKLPGIGDIFVNRDSGAHFSLVNIVENKRGEKLAILETPDAGARVTLRLDSFFSGLSVEGGPWSGVTPEVTVV